MAEKILKSRIVHKHDLESNWVKATGFSPKQGEIIIYDKDSSHPYERLKIGDGTTNVNDLPFVEDTLRTELLAEISKMTTGTTTVKNAEHAASADRATTADSANAVAWGNVSGKPSTYTPAAHNHNDTYYTESEIDGKFDSLVGTTSVAEQISDAIANKVDKVSGKGLSTNDYTTTEKNKLSGIATGAEVNQNAFSNIVVGSTTIAADAKTDTLTLVADGSITITPDATNDKITIAATDTVYTHPNSGVTAGTYRSVTVNAQGHVTGGTNPTTLAGYGIMDAAEKSHGTHVTYSPTAPVMDGTASVGSADTVARSDHKHPTDTSRAAASDVAALEKLVGNTAVSAQISDALTVHTTNTSNPHSVTKAQVGLGNVENKSSATIRGELTKADVTAALGYTPPEFDTNSNTTYNLTTSQTSGQNVKLNLIAGGTGSGTNSAIEIVGGGATNVYRDTTSGIIVIESTDRDSTYSAANTSLGLVKSGGDVTISGGIITVNDDSHDHIIDNIDGLQAALNGKAAVSSVEALEDLVGETAVSAQISNAVASYIPTSQKGAANGVASLDANGKVPTAQLPSYVDDVLEYAAQSSFPSTGETGKIYVDTATNKTYRWSGSTYVEISASLALGTTSSTAYRGDYGNTAYTHSQKTSGNPHGVTKSDVGLSNVENKSSATIRGELTKANVTAALGYTPPTQDTTYSPATTSAAGLMSAEDKNILNNLDTLVGSTPVSAQISNAIATKANTLHSHHSLIEETAGELVWNGDHFLSSSDRPNTKIHFGSEMLYRYDMLSGAYYPILDSNNYASYCDPNSIGAVDLNSNQTVGGNKTFTGTTSTMILHTYNPLYVNNGTDNSKSTSLYTNDSNVFAITSSANDMTFNGKNVAVVDDITTTAITTAGTGAAYTATVPGITSLTVGASFIMIPHTVSTSTQPTLNVNGLGAKKILRRTSAVATGSQAGASAGWLLANYPFRLVYDGTVWIAVEQPKPAASDLQGTVAVNKGGTGKTTLTSGSYLVGNGTSAVALKTPAEVLTDIGAASATDLNTLVGDTSVAEQIAAATEGLGGVGQDVAGQSFATHGDGTTATAGTGAEIFNDYRTRTYASSTSSVPTAGNVATGTYSHAEGTRTTATGNYSHAEGYRTTASGDYSHAEGESTKATGINSHTEGYNTTASGQYSHAEGSGTKATGNYSHAEGNGTTASGQYSHAEGSGTTASGNYSHAEGNNTTALAGQHAQGHFNNTTTATAGGSTGTTGTAFVIGNGSGNSDTLRTNAFRVTYAGTPYALSALTTTGCDYAEFFEWQDLNPNAEDRRGYFVTLDGDKIKIAEPNDYILGIVSGQPSVIGNGDEDWMGRYILDEFGAFINEEFEYEEEVHEEIVNEETGEVTIEVKTVTMTGTRYKQNPDYDPTKGYEQRSDRPEWSAIGMLGVLSVRDDGTCEVNGYCTVAEGGTATKADTGYRVIKRVNDHIVKVIFR